MIPLCDLRHQYLQLRAEIDEAVLRTARSGTYILGPEVRALEQELADFCGCEFAVGVGSGTDALHLSLRAMGIGPGDEVVTTPFTFIATSEAISLVGATPVFVDIDPVTFNIDPGQIEAALTKRTKAIVPVHLYGQPCDMDPIMQVADQYRLRVIEDCAQALGASYKGQAVGSFGITGCLSFFPSKNLGCFGDGGMVVTNDRKVYDRIEMLRRHGGKVKYRHSEVGLNSRLDEIQAAVLRVKFKRLEAWNRNRRSAAARYNRLLGEFTDLEILRPKVLTRDGVGLTDSADARPADVLVPVYHQYTIQSEQRDALSASLRERGVQTFAYYPIPLHRQDVHADLGYQPGSMPMAEKAAQQCLSLPIFPGLSTKTQAQIVAEIARAGGESSVAKKSNEESKPSIKTVDENFSMSQYEELLCEFRNAGYKFGRFTDPPNRRPASQSLVLLRHDIDMELERAYEMARLEAAANVQATYFFLIRTDHYNIFSRESTETVRAILKLGHQLGLHFDCAAYDESSDVTSIGQLANSEARLLGDWFDQKVDIVSFHRPSPVVLAGSPNLTHPLKHTYMPEFVAQMHYCSDSRGKFRYGRPTESAAFLAKRPIHLLIHPIWWGPRSDSPQESLRQFVDRRRVALEASVAANCDVFRAKAETAAA